ncbi:MAG: DHHA1 domain-containing protein [Candidatus Aenigmatarchaeota archaeon]
MDNAPLHDLLATRGKKILLYHTDVDGICSAALFQRFFVGYSTIPLEGPIISDKLLGVLSSEKPRVITALDLPIDQEWKKIGKLLIALPSARIAIIDHHVPLKDMNSERIMHVNPRFLSNAYIPASVLVYRMLLDMGKDAGDLVWIAAVGVIGDFAYVDCADILRECEKKYPALCEGKLDKAETLSKKLMSAVILEGAKGAEKALAVMLAAKGAQDMLSDPYLNACYDSVEKEIDAAVGGFAEKSEKIPSIGLYLYEVQSKLNIASTVSTRVAALNPDKMIFIVKHSGPFVKVSARYQKGDISLNDLFKEVTKGIGSGGGHEKAAGAVVERKHWDEFRMRVVARLTEMKMKNGL